MQDKNINPSFVFFGTPHFSVIVLEELLRSGYHPALVVTSPDKKVGRKQILTPSKVKEFGLKNGLNVKTPQNKNELKGLFHVETRITRASHEQCAGQTRHGASLQKNGEYDFGILAAYGVILSPEVINLFPHGILNIHPSLLPKYRGSTPIQTAILNGDAETGVTIIKLNEKIDEGDILAQEKLPILPNNTTITLGEKLFRAGAKLLIKILPAYLNGKVNLIFQDTLCIDDSNHRYRGETKINPSLAIISRSTITRKFTKQDGFVELSDLKKAVEGDKELSSVIDRKFRAFTPWPGVWTKNFAGRRVLITKCHLENGVLIIERMKEEGKEETENFLI